MTNSIPPQVPPDVTEVHEQIAALRAKVDDLMNKQVTPAVVAAADRAERLAHRATDQLDQLSSCVRERPLASVGASFVAGYVISALVRR